MILQRLYMWHMLSYCKIAARGTNSFLDTDCGSDTTIELMQAIKIHMHAAPHTQAADWYDAQPEHWRRQADVFLQGSNACIKKAQCAHQKMPVIAMAMPQNFFERHFISKEEAASCQNEDGLHVSHHLRPPHSTLVLLFKMSL